MQWVSKSSQNHKERQRSIKTDLGGGGQKRFEGMQYIQGVGFE
jgi:hypothetical protein